MWSCPLVSCLFIYYFNFECNHKHQSPTTSIRESCNRKQSKNEDEDKCWNLSQCFIARKQVQEFPLHSVYYRVTSDEKRCTAVIILHLNALGIACCLLSFLAVSIKKELNTIYCAAELHRTNSVCQIALDSLRYSSDDRQLLDVTAGKIAT